MKERSRYIQKKHPSTHPPLLDRMIHNYCVTILFLVGYALFLVGYALLTHPT